MNAALRVIPTPELQAQFEALKAELDRRTEALRLAKWARGKAEECLQRAREIEATPTHGRLGKQGRNRRAAHFARAEAKDWELKAKRYDKEAGVAEPEYQHPF